MCGIAGIWQLDGQKVERNTVERFISALAHRGPDGEGVLIDDGGQLALAHRRLERGVKTFVDGRGVVTERGSLERASHLYLRHSRAESTVLPSMNLKWSDERRNRHFNHCGTMALLCLFERLIESIWVIIGVKPDICYAQFARIFLPKTGE